MSNEPLEIQKARANDLKNELNENAQIDKLMGKLKTMKAKPLSQIRDEAHQAIAEKSIWGYAMRSTKQILTMIQTVSNTKRNASVDTKLQALMEGQKLLSALIVSQKYNNRQLHEMKPTNER